jgi:site-specific recombinase XerC
MELAIDGSSNYKTSWGAALDYRDGLLISLLALIPLRLRTVTALRIGTHLVKSGDSWALDIPAEDVKTKRALEYPLCVELSEQMNVYLNRFRPCIPGAASHDSIWAARSGQPLSDRSIYERVVRRTFEGLALRVNPHRFRHAAAALWSVQDPANVRGVKDLLGHASFRTTEKHYIMAQSRMAGRMLDRAIDAVKR